MMTKRSDQTTVAEFIDDAIRNGPMPSGHAYMHDGKIVHVLVLQGEWKMKVMDFISKEIGRKPNLTYNSDNPAVNEIVKSMEKTESMVDELLKP